MGHFSAASSTITFFLFLFPITCKYQYILYNTGKSAYYVSNVCLLRIIKTSTEWGRPGTNIYAVYYALMWRRSGFITVEQNEAPCIQYNNNREL